MNYKNKIQKFRNEIGREPQAFELCPKFEKCQLNKCPLHIDYKKLKNDFLDPAIQNREKCITKSIRKRIGIIFRLKNQGMTERERSASKKWAELPEDVKKKRIAKLKQFSPVSRCLEKGLVVSRKSKNYAQIPQTKDIKTSKKHN